MNKSIYSHDRSAYSAAGNMLTDPGNKQIARRHMNVGIGTEAAQFPEKEYISGIFVAVCHITSSFLCKYLPNFLLILSDQGLFGRHQLCNISNIQSFSPFCQIS
jgi:hypothetical protein